MKTFNKIREFFWPLLENGEEQIASEISENDIHVESENLHRVLELTIKRYESEEDRKKSVESKSSLFISTISVVTTVIIGVTTLLIKEIKEFNVAIFVLIFLLFILSIYMARAIWFSIQTLERKKYHSLSESDFFISGKADDFNKSLIVKITNITNNNSIVINGKVDSMTMAQEYFKRAIVTISIYSFSLLLFYFSKSDFDFSSIIFFMDGININLLNTIVLYVLIVISLIIGVLAYIKAKTK